MSTSKPKPRKGRYTKKRGGGSHLLDINCAACGEHVMLYQKDGTGALLRAYLDRIVEPPALSGLQHEHESKSGLPNLECPACGAVIGVPMLYAKEKRLAFRMIKGRYARTKKKHAG